MENSEQSTITVVHVTHQKTRSVFAGWLFLKISLNQTGASQESSARIVEPLGINYQLVKDGKVIWYCSKEKKHWSLHKHMCTPGERSSGVLKLVETFIANSILFSCLQVCTIIDLDLLKNPKTGFDFPFIARVDLGIEPSDVLSFAQLYLTHEPIDIKLEGMVQVNRFHSHFPGQFQCALLTPKRMEMWLRARKEGRSSNPVGLLEIVYNLKNDHSITTPFHISPQSLFVEKKAVPLQDVVSKVEVSISVASCMEFINLHIRSDKQNQYKLRVEMIEADKEVIRGAADRENGKEAVCLLREKMARETLYANLLLNR